MKRGGSVLHPPKVRRDFGRLLAQFAAIGYRAVIPPAETIRAEDRESSLGRKLNFRERIAFGWYNLSGKNRAAADQGEM